MSLGGEWGVKIIDCARDTLGMSENLNSIIHKKSIYY